MMLLPGCIFDMFEFGIWYIWIDIWYVWKDIRYVWIAFLENIKLYKLNNHYKDYFRDSVTGGQDHLHPKSIAK